MATWLIVDDHAGFRRLARRLMEGSEHQVVGEAASGRAAIDATRRLQPEAVLLDVNLPDASGFDLVPAFAGAAVVLTSSHDVSDYGELARGTGACAFVAKHELSVATLSAALGSADIG